MSGQNRTSISLILFLGVFITAALAISSTSSALEIKVTERLETDKDMVYLGDIATFQPESDSRVEKFKEIEITASPSPDTFRRINRDLINYKLSRAINAEKDIVLTVPDGITIERKAQVINRDKLEKIFNDYVMDNAPWDRDRIVIEKINAPSSLALPTGQLDWEIDEKQNNNFTGNFSLMVDFIVDGESQRKIIVSGKISVIREIVKAARNIDSGEIISPRDVVLVSEKRRYFKRSLVTDTKEVIGKRATRRIQADQMIQSGMFEVPPAIEKGDMIVIKAESSELLITASGEALEDGCVGDQIRVVNVSSGREIMATVRKTDLVEVSF